MSSPQLSEDDSKLISTLYSLSHKNPKLVRSSAYSAPADPGKTVRSWKMNEFKYYDVPSPFPTLARGLFTEKVEGGTDNKNIDPNGKYRIVARGYDKFFNIGEVPWTTWSALEKYTEPPYVLTLKSNGCIIFIAALTPSKLLITSKHSLGPVEGSPVSHAERGEQWLRKHLESVGKTEEQLASKLWENNWTAVAELCDDSFEEHVLPYAEDKTGLHLHGINESTGVFKTKLPDVVNSFATEWGFIPTAATTLTTIPEVKAFTDEVGKTGQWNGEALEGFVVRSHVSAPKDDTPSGAGSRRDAPPYGPGSSFFFKVKFDEPYMMYRDWREITKSLLSTKGPLSQAKVPKSKLKRPESKLYYKWVMKEIQRDRKPFEQFNKGKGIIATRERYLDFLKGDEGKKSLTETSGEESEAVSVDGKKFGKTIIVPIAIPGCGKTSISVALTHLFGFGHTQSDDVKQKKAAPVFIQNVVNLLKDHDVVIADKNNHLRQHRNDLRQAVASMNPPVRLLAMNWSFDLPLSTIHRVCGDRISLRGDNHQTLLADTVSKTHEEVIWMFLNNSEELAEGEVDAVIEMDMEENLEQALDRAVDGCVRILGLPKPDQEKVGEALAIARRYSPTVKNKITSKKSSVRYFGFLPEIDIGKIIEERLATDNGVPQALRDFWVDIRKKDRVVKRPHVTVVHSKSLPAEVELWDRCMALHLHSSPPLFNFKLKNLVCNGRVMAVTVEDLAVENGGEDAGQEAGEFVSKLHHEVREALHITVGTRNTNIMPVEAKALVSEWRKEKTGSDVTVLSLDNVQTKGRIKGLFN